MTNEEAIKNIKELLRWYLKEEPMSETVYKREAVEMAIKALEQQPSEDCISREAVLDGIDKYIKKAQSTGIKDDFISFEELVVKQLPPVTPRTNLAETSQDCIRELIREFDNKHPAVFADYMREFNNHPLSEIIEYMWDMHDLLEDIKYRLPDDGGGEE